MDQNGGTNLPRFNLGLGRRSRPSTSTPCPRPVPTARSCSSRPVSASIANLGTAVNTAASSPGVVAISNSYGGGDLSDATYGSYYNHPGIAVTASTG